MNIQEITITKTRPVKGSNMIRWHFDRDGKAFGIVWTYRNTATETHPFHAKPLTGEYRCFLTYKEAETYMRGEM